MNTFKKRLNTYLISITLIFIFSAVAFLNPVPNQSELFHINIKQSIHKITANNNELHNHCETINEEEEIIFHSIINDNNLKTTNQFRTVVSTLSYINFHKPYFNFLTYYLYRLLSFF